MLTYPSRLPLTQLDYVYARGLKPVGAADSPRPDLVAHVGPPAADRGVQGLAAAMSHALPVPARRPSSCGCCRAAASCSRRWSRPSTRAQREVRLETYIFDFTGAGARSGVGAGARGAARREREGGGRRLRQPRAAAGAGASASLQAGVRLARLRAARAAGHAVAGQLAAAAPQAVRRRRHGGFLRRHQHPGRFPRSQPWRR